MEENYVINCEVGNSPFNPVMWKQAEREGGFFSFVSGSR